LPTPIPTSLRISVKMLSTEVPAAAEAEVMVSTR